MTKSTSEKSFDCIEYKRRVQQEIYEQVKDMTPDEEAEYFRHAAETGPFGHLVRVLRQQEERKGSKRSAARSLPLQRP